MAHPRPDDDALDRLAHDLRGGLTLIRGHADLARRHLRRGDPPDPVRLAFRLTAIGQAVAALVALAEELEARRRRGRPDGG